MLFPENTGDMEDHQCWRHERNVDNERVWVVLSLLELSEEVQHVQTSLDEQPPLEVWNGSFIRFMSSGRRQS